MYHNNATCLQRINSQNVLWQVLYFDIIHKKVILVDRSYKVHINWSNYLIVHLFRCIHDQSTEYNTTIRRISMILYNHHNGVKSSRRSEQLIWKYISCHSSCDTQYTDQMSLDLLSTCWLMTLILLFGSFAVLTQMESAVFHPSNHQLDSISWCIQIILFTKEEINQSSQN